MVIDVYSGSNRWIERVLSNLHPNSFVIDNVRYTCVESFLQALKCKEYKDTRRFPKLSGIEARELGQAFNGWRKDQTLYYQGSPFHRLSDAYQILIENLYYEVAVQCRDFRKGLIESKGCDIIHSMGSKDPSMTILTESEFCNALKKVRSML